MEKLSMCRVCLEEDIRLLSTVETHLQELYESLVLTPFETKDRRPILVCCICCARLKNCYNLRRSCLQSEELFTQMQNCAELEAVQLQGIDNKMRLTMHHVIQLNVGHVPQMSADNIGVEALTFDDVKVEKDDPEDIDEDALEEYIVYAIIQSADSDDDSQIIVKGDESGVGTSDPTPKESEQSVQRNTEDLTSSNPKEHKLVQDMFKALNKVIAAEKTAAKSTNEVTFTLNDINKERSTSVSHSERVQYTCDTCQRCYSSKCRLERHIRLCSDVWKKDLSRENSTSSHTHTGQRPYQCHVCKKSFSFMCNFTGHMRTHTGERPYHCDICKKQFSQKGTLTKHMRRHTGEKPYLCDICKKRFPVMSELTRHIHTHIGQKPHQCHACKKNFSRKAYLNHHIRTQTREKPYHCDICKRSFPLLCTFTKHMRTHTGEEPYHCNICKKEFSEKGTLTKHMRRHTGEKPYLCDICKKRFQFMSELTLHIHTHTGQKPHQCHACKKSFSRKVDLTHHIRAQTREKPYPCDICKKSFPLRCTFTEHMRTHTGEKPYHCDVCKKCFSDWSNLTRHIRTHTGKKHVKQRAFRFALT